MKRTTILAVTTSLVLGLAAQQSQAHRAWLLPSTFTLSGEDQLITVDGAISNDLFYPNHVAMSLDNIVVTAPDGSPVEILNAASGKIRSVFDVQLTQQGTYRIGQSGRSFFARWTEDGENRRKRGNLEELLAAGLDKKTDARLTVSNRSLATFVTLGAPTNSVFEVSGNGLEFVPETHPNDLFAGDNGRFRIYLGGEPAAGIEVTIVKGNDRYRNTAGARIFETNADGFVSVPFTEPGSYWMSAEDEGTAEIDGHTMVEFNSFVVTFEVLPE